MFESRQSQVASPSTLLIMFHRPFHIANTTHRHPPSRRVHNESRVLSYVLHNLLGTVRHCVRSPLSVEHRTRSLDWMAAGWLALPFRRYYNVDRNQLFLAYPNLPWVNVIVRPSRFAIRSHQPVSQSVKPSTHPQLIKWESERRRKAQKNPPLVTHSNPHQAVSTLFKGYAIFWLIPLNSICYK